MNIKMWIFIITILFAGYYDYRWRIIPNYIPIIIILTSLIADFNLIESLIGLIFISIPFIIPIYFDYNSVGGGDIKYMGSIGFFLGLEKALSVLILGLILAIVINVIILRRKGNEIFPLAPYIGASILIII